MAAAEIKTSLGIINISEQVLATIARDTALQINEVMSMDGRYSHGISSVIGDGDAEGVRVSIRNKNVIIYLRETWDENPCCCLAVTGSCQRRYFSIYGNYCCGG